MYQTNPPRSPKEVLPTMYDLPSEDPEEPGLPDEFHDLQPQFLRETFRPPSHPPDQVFVASDLNLYYDPRHPLWYKRPDWFAVVGIPRLYEQRELRLSYVIWQEGVDPSVVVELLSPGTEKEDLGQTLRDVNQPPTKWEVYEQILRVPYYIVFNRYSNQLQAFQNLAGRYQELNLTKSTKRTEVPSGRTLTQSQLWLPELGLGLGLWQGEYEGIEGLWMRWRDVEGKWIPTSAERAEQERQQVEQERQRADQAELQLEIERQRVEQLAARLRELGLNPDE